MMNKKETKKKVSIIKVLTFVEGNSDVQKTYLLTELHQHCIRFINKQLPLIIGKLNYQIKVI